MKSGLDVSPSPPQRRYPLRGTRRKPPKALRRGVSCKSQSGEKMERRSFCLATKFVKKHPLIVFFLLAYGLTWMVQIPATIFPGWPELLTFLGAFGPVVAAFIVVGFITGKDGVQQLINPIKKWRVGIQWYFIVLFGPTLMMASSIYLYRLLGRESGTPVSISMSSMVVEHFLALFIIFIYQAISVWGEEVGWRGFALPSLQIQFHPIPASVILGVLWGLWHLPLFWIEGSAQQSMSVQFFVLATVGYSIIYTWIYNGTRGSLLMMCLLHAANNTTVSYTMLFFKPIIEEPVFSLTVLGLFNLLVIVIAGPKLLWRNSTATFVQNSRPPINSSAKR
jgi:membrane protease YdiL (CAAX protease family)